MEGCAGQYEERLGCRSLLLGGVRGLWLGGEGEVVGLEVGFCMLGVSGWVVDGLMGENWERWYSTSKSGVGGGCEEGDEGGEGRAATEGAAEHG